MPETNLHAYVREHLIATLAQIQADASREVPELTDATVPLRDLPGFDSLNGVEAAVLLSERLGVELDEIAFLTPGGERELAIGEIVDTIVKRHGATLTLRVLPDAAAAPGSTAGAGGPGTAVRAAAARARRTSAVGTDVPGPVRPAGTR